MLAMASADSTAAVVAKLQHEPHCARRAAWRGAARHVAQDAGVVQAEKAKAQVDATIGVWHSRAPHGAAANAAAWIR